jgi:superfamily II DNA or RNA helicase
VIKISEGPTKLTVTGDSNEVRAVSKALCYRPDGYYHSPRYQAYRLTDGREGWDGFVTPLQINDDGVGVALRGHKDAIIRTARRMDYTVDTRECLESPFKSIQKDDIPDDLIQADFPLDDFQRESVAFWLRHGMGVNKIAVNGGKTAMFAAAAAMIERKFGKDCRILYLTQSERLVRQAFTELRKFLPGWHITQYGGGKRDNTGKDMVISTAAMLWKHHQDLYRNRWFHTFIAIFYDESHHVASPTSHKIMMLMPSYFRFGASDTRKDKSATAKMKITGLLGPIRFTVPVGVYINIGRSAKPTIYIVDKPEWKSKFRGLPHHAAPNSPAWALWGNEWKRGRYIGPVYERNEDGTIKTRRKRELEKEVDEATVYTNDGIAETIKMARWSDVDVPITVDGYHTLEFDNDPKQYEVESTYCLLERVNDRAIIRFKERNQLIVDWTRYYSVTRKFPTLVVCTRTIHIYILETLIKKAIGEDKVSILLGEHTSKERDRTFDWFRHTPGGVLISPLVQEGVSINEIRGGVIADYIGDWERANQIVGRFIRKKEVDNEAHITWFFDSQHKTLRSGSQRVLEKLIDIRGYTFAYPCSGPESIKTAQFYRDLS